MTNNDCLRRIRYILDFDDERMIAVFELAGEDVERSELLAWLRQDEHPDFKLLGDFNFAAFLNGLIVALRGPKDGEPIRNETELNNNLIFLKLKIALNLKAEDILQILELDGQLISKHELSAFFRRKDHKHYRECKDQILRNFLNGLRFSYRD